MLLIPETFRNIMKPFNLCLLLPLSGTRNTETLNSMFFIDTIIVTDMFDEVIVVARN